jgi:hypothetical protein
VPAISCNDVDILFFLLFFQSPPSPQGFVALYATMASSDVDICLIPEAPFSVDKLCKVIGDRIDEKGHCLIVVAEVNVCVCVCVCVCVYVFSLSLSLPPSLSLFLSHY